MNPLRSAFVIAVIESSPRFIIVISTELISLADVLTVRIIPLDLVERLRLSVCEKEEVFLQPFRVDNSLLPRLAHSHVKRRSFIGSSCKIASSSSATWKMRYSVDSVKSVESAVVESILERLF